LQISRVIRFQRRIAAGLIVPMLLWCADASALVLRSQEIKPQAIVVSVDVKSNYIIIKYEFEADVKGSYLVTFDLLNTDEPSFRLPLRSVSGDVGIVNSSRGTREVQWDFTKDFPSGIGNGGYYFRISLIKTEGRSNLWYYIGGGLAVVAGVAAVLVFSKQASSSASPELPSAPLRPAQ
jgi:hypothetical protein